MENDWCVERVGQQPVGRAVNCWSNEMLRGDDWNDRQKADKAEASITSSKKRKRPKRPAPPERPGSVEEVYAFEDGYRVVRLVSCESYRREGTLMKNCVGSLCNITDVVYSLRDPDNQPHADILRAVEGVLDVKGKANSKVAKKYRPYVMAFLNAGILKLKPEEMRVFD